MRALRTEPESRGSFLLQNCSDGLQCIRCRSTCGHRSKNENTKRSKVIRAVGEAAASVILILCEIAVECVLVGSTPRQGVSTDQCFAQAEEKMGVGEDNGDAIQGCKKRGLVVEVALENLSSFSGSSLSDFT